MAQKSDGQEDLRVQRTRKLLQQALFELAIEKGFAPVEFCDITQKDHNSAPVQIAVRSRKRLVRFISADK